MNKVNIDGVLIVEGKDDVSYLSSFLNAQFFTTNGYDINEDKLNFLKEVAKVNKLIIYTDNDEAGEKIRNVIKSNISGTFDVKSAKMFRKNTKKFGVAELEKEEVLRSLAPYVTTKPIVKNRYNLASLISLSSNSDARDKLIKKYRLINGTIKSLENQLNLLKVEPEEVKELLSGN